MGKVIKFKFEGKEGFFSVIEKPHVFYTLAQKNTPKVDVAKQTHQLTISFDIKQPVYRNVNVKVIDDKTIIKEVYDQLEKDKNLYFKQLDDSLCVLEIQKENK